MTNISRRLGAIVIGMASSLTMTQTAVACSSGFLAQVGCAMGFPEELMRQGDRFHHQLGSPLDRVPGAVLGTIHPGLGMAYEANQAFIHSGPTGGAALPFPEGAAPFGQPAPSAGAFHAHRHIFFDANGRELVFEGGPNFLNPSDARAFYLGSAGAAYRVR